ncbi:MAG: CPBP family intramembrane metalloprotease [Chloroflexota bacterium]|jgi:membrane protease YdiL (CAAX protease family)
MKLKLNARTAFLVVLLYLVLSILAALLAAVFFGGIDESETDRLIDGVIDSGMYGTIIVLIVLLFISIYVFKDSRRDIFFERKPFYLSKLYYLFPLAWFGVTVVALLNVDYSAYSLGEILLILLATLAIGANEEIVTRGILLIGLRNSGVTEWKAWLMTVAVFALLHLVNVLGGDSPTILLVTAAGGTLLYVARRTFNNLFVPIGLHALYDAAFFLLTGKYLVGESLLDGVLDLQLASFLVLLVATILFIIFGRDIFRRETTGW